ncbi:ParA family protein, partial [Acinetobacter baumannii]|nr:ParA family protein [Acinetobacter baumannii]
AIFSDIFTVLEERNEYCEQHGDIEEFDITHKHAKSMANHILHLRKAIKLKGIITDEQR